MSGGMNIPDLLSMAASAAQQQGGQGPQSIQPGGQNLNSFGPAPLLQPPPLPQMQAPQTQPSDKQPTSFPSVGARKRSDQQSTLHGIASMVKTGSDYVTANKTRGLQMDIERLMGAQQGVTEAQDKLKQDPNDPEAKKTLEHNVGIINYLTKDPKKSKMFQKAFNIDLFGNGKNKQENQALIEAWQNFSKKQKEGDKTALNPVAQKLMQGQPQRQQLNPQAQQQAMAIKMGLIPGADEILKQGVEVQKSITTAKSADERSVAIVEASKIRAKAEDKHSGALLDAANVRALGQQNAAEIHSRAQTYIANKHSQDWDKRIGMMREIATGKNQVQMDKIASLEKIANDKNKTAEEKLSAQKELNKVKSSQGIILNMAKEAGTYNTELQRLVKENRDAQVELDKKGSNFMGIKFGAASDADSQILRNKITTNNRAMIVMQGKLKEVQKKMQMLNQMGMLMLPEQASEQALDEPDDQDPEKMFPKDSADEN